MEKSMLCNLSNIFNKPHLIPAGLTGILLVTLRPDTDLLINMGITLPPMYIMQPVQFKDRIIGTLIDGNENALKE